MILRGSCENVTISSFDSFSVSFCAFISSLPIQPEMCEVLWVSLAVHELYQKLLEVGVLVKFFGCAPLPATGFCCCLASKLLEMACGKHGLGTPALLAAAMLRSF